MSDPQEVQAPFEAMARLGRALANSHRLRLLHLLGQCERTVESLADAMDLPPVTVSHHLQSLRRAGLLTAQKTGRHVVYGLANAGVKTFWLHYRKFATERLAELRVIASDLTIRRTALGCVDRVTVQTLLASDAAVLADVRPTPEFDAGHLPGAISLPTDEIARRWSELPTGKVIVLYCRGPHCLLADEAQHTLADHGIRSLRMEEGVPEWESAGLPVTRSPHFHPVIDPAVS